MSRDEHETSLFSVNEHAIDWLQLKQLLEVSNSRFDDFNQFFFFIKITRYVTVWLFSVILTACEIIFQSRIIAFDTVLLYRVHDVFPF